ncbi:MAG: EAL domain-containing protein, partial [Planctomycetota bacterium]|nr:EAL domain-containing protein [Planctomycetota bacterium]
LDEEAKEILRTIVEMAHSLDLKIVAEGVETEGERDLLAELGCEYGQGWLFAKPMPAEEV